MVPPANPDPRRRRRGLGYERHIALLALLTGAPGAVVALSLLWLGDYEPRVRWTLTLFVVVCWWALVAVLRDRVIRPIQTLSNLLSALLEGDYSLRPTSARSDDDALGLAFREVNALGQTLREQRLGALEATALLRKVMDEIDVAVFTFDHERRLRLLNRAGERLLARPSERLLGLTADDLGLSDALDGGEGPRTFEATFPGQTGRWEARTGEFRQGGLPHRLLVLTDLSRALREEERQAWQRLVRVLGHEINNSLAPIKSIAASLQSLLGREPAPADLHEDLRSGLHVIASRTESLSRFMTAYARLARLPPPTPGPVDVGAWVREVVALETRLEVAVVDGPPLVIRADGDQLDQLLINLVRNAADAAAETGGGVSVGWRLGGPGLLEVFVEDEGPGLPETANLFVPFFTTKPGGTGVGLVLSRQIAEAHGGSLALVDREDRRGCRAVLRLPVHGPNGG